MKGQATACPFCFGKHGYLRLRVGTDSHSVTKDNGKAWEHGVDGRERLTECRWLNDFLRQCRQTLR
jgi:hypothetical protein